MDILLRPMRKIIYILMLMLFAGCSPKVVAPEVVYVPKVEKEYVIREKVDTIIERDTIKTHTYTKNDTVYVESETTRNRYRSNTEKDTVLVTDTLYIPVDKPYPVEVEREITFFEELQINVGRITMVVFLISLLVKILKWKHK